MSRLRDLQFRKDADGDEITDHYMYMDDESIEEAIFKWYKKICPDLGRFPQKVRWQLENEVIAAAERCAKHTSQIIRARVKRKKEECENGKRSAMT